MTGTTWVWEPPAGADALFASGAPFEISTELVLGVDCKVFKNRLGNIREVLTAFTARHGDLPNLVFPEITLTFNDVQASTARVAAWFAERGVVKGDRVAFASANVASYVIGWWATLASGAIVSSLNGWWTPGELLHGIELSKPRLVFADGPRMKRLLEAGLPEDVAVQRVRPPPPRILRLPTSLERHPVLQRVHVLLLRDIALTALPQLASYLCHVTSNAKAAYHSLKRNAT